MIAPTVRPSIQPLATTSGTRGGGYSVRMPYLAASTPRRQPYVSRKRVHAAKQRAADDLDPVADEHHRHLSQVGKGAHEGGQQHVRG